jgi:hypothetical protein
MAEVTLSILIPSTPDRAWLVEGLFLDIQRQCGYVIDSNLYVSPQIENANIYGFMARNVEVIVYEDNKELTLGEKRQRMYQLANGLYSFQLDSDDCIAPNFIDLVLDAITDQPDVISYEEKVAINGIEYQSNFSNEYADWEGDGSKMFPDGFHFHRTVFYKCVIRTSLAQSVPFLPIRFGEDHEFAKALKPKIKSEVHIPRQLYLYTHNSKPEDFKERYGF